MISSSRSRYVSVNNIVWPLLKSAFTQDDRHIEQKKRIRFTGIRRRFYLVEEFDVQDAGNYETFVKSIQTCMNQTILVE
jgi:hypothetical protein